MTQDKLKTMLKAETVKRGAPLGLSTIAETPAHKVTTGASDRARHTVYLSKTLMRAIDAAFKGAAHDLYPQEIEKADYLEACLNYALTHQNEIKTALAGAGDTSGKE